MNQRQLLIEQVQHSFCTVAVPYELSESDVRDLIILKIQESLTD